MSIIRTKKYVEQQALSTLHYVCDFDLSMWKWVDKPDLQSAIEKYGIEVVQDIYESEQMQTRFVEAIWKKPYSEINEKKIERFKKMGGSFSVENGIVQSASLASTDNNPKHLIKTIENKIEHYK